ncbi:MAG TPA: hypothetical protein PLU83_06725, partial [Phycicoccus sp.]|nr:hypothetical protein [Phycicoccus sp.]
MTMPSPELPVAPVGTDEDAKHGIVRPSRPVSGLWLWLFGLAWFGFWLLVMLPGQIMLAQLAKALDEA